MTKLKHRKKCISRKSKMADDSIEYADILSINISDFHTSARLCALPELKVCRCCLAMDISMAYSSEYFDDLLDLLTASKLPDGPSMSWLCYRCAHTMKKLSAFRDLCLRADSVLREYCLNYMEIDKDDLQHIKKEHQKIVAASSPSLSNTVCIDVLTPNPVSSCSESRVQVVFFNGECETQVKNFTEGMKLMDKSDVAALEVLRKKDAIPNNNINLEWNPSDFGLSDAAFQIVIVEDSGKTETLVQPKKGDMELISPEIASFMSDFICTFNCKACKQTFGNPQCLPNHYKFCKGKRIERVELRAGIIRSNLMKGTLTLLQSQATSTLQKSLDTTSLIVVPDTCRENPIVSEQVQLMASSNSSNQDDACFKCSECDKSFSQPSFLKRHSLSHTNEKPFRCEKCGKCFKISHHLKSHMWTHVERKPHVCDVCGRSFPHASYLKSHLNSHTGNRPFSCTECGNSFGTSSALISHKLTHSVADNSCSPCGHSFTSGALLREHQSTAHSVPATAYACPECPRVLPSASALRRHLPSHSQERPHTCQRCGKGFKLASQLRAHEWIHEERKPHICGECGASFHCPSYLKVHMLKHSAVRPHVCSECGKAFKTIGNLNAHAAVHTDARPHTCGECGVSVRSAALLREHVRLHTNERPFVCAECGKAFRRAVTLKIHKRIHTGEKPFVCKVCEKRFIRRGELIAHNRTHTGERPYSCQTCGKAFASRGTLISHWRVHSGVKQYVCDECGKSFTGPSYLKVHKRVHSGERFSCDICPYISICRSRVKVHRMAHTGEKPHVCDLCGYKTTTNKHLKQHKLTHEKRLYY